MIFCSIIEEFSGEFLIFWDTRCGLLLFFLFSTYLLLCQFETSEKVVSSFEFHILASRY